MDTAAITELEACLASKLSALSPSPDTITASQTLVDSLQCSSSTLLGDSPTEKHLSDAYILTPRAGPFEGQLLAFITVGDGQPIDPVDCEVKIRSIIRTPCLIAFDDTIGLKIPADSLPAIWILVEKMPFDKDTSNRRKLQTWIKNANEVVYRQVTSNNSDTNVDLVHDQIAGTIRQVLKYDLTNDVLDRPVAELDSTLVQIPDLAGSTDIPQFSNGTAELFG
ncbi:hypothetical protein F5Y17DRAFT_463843 [Xylariaceae sp. FL0594]|nr:hypothetical protein F5Y17DRAFT_463843 [Xylariaceae sp. FL0594]